MALLGTGLKTGSSREPLRVVQMAIVLAFAAFLGAALGLVWHGAGLDEDAAEEATPAVAASDG